MTASGADATSTVTDVKRARRPLRAQLMKRINELMKRINELNHELSRSTPDATLLQVKLEMLQKTYEKVDVLDQQLMTVIARDGSDEEQDAELAAISEYEEKYRIVKVRVENLLEEKTSESASVSSDDTSTHRSGVKRIYKLPKIEIRKFNGEIKEWLGFWSQF